MLDYARQRAAEALKDTRQAVLVTNGPAGVQVGEYPCEAAGLALYLLVPKISDHLFNLEHGSQVTVMAAGWQMKGEAQVISSGKTLLALDLLRDPGVEWCSLLRVEPAQVQVRREGGWGSLETIDLPPR